jgi:hypothetical protein
VRGVDHLGLCGSPVPGKFPEKVFPDAAPRPANKPVIDRRRRTIFGWTIAPAATAFQHMHNAADNAPIVHSLDTSHIRWQMGLDALPLLIAQPKQIPPHDPDPPKRISSVWNQDCFATAPKLMSSHPSHTTMSQPHIISSQGGPRRRVTMLRHACGYALANKGHDTRAIQGWLGHRSITSTAVYTAPGAEPVQGLLAGLRQSVMIVSETVNEPAARSSDTSKLYGHDRGRTKWIEFSVADLRPAPR